MTTQLAPKIDGSTTQLGLPPPGAIELTDGDRVVGWVDGRRVGFRGFASAEEAAHAAWVAYRALSRRVARRLGRTPVPIDAEPLAIHRRGADEVIVAAGRDVARLVMFSGQGPEGSDAFAFEIEVPGPIDALMVRAKAYVMYRTLRKSGIRWQLWRRPTKNPTPRLRIIPSDVASAPKETHGTDVKDADPADRASQRRLALAVVSLVMIGVAFAVPRAFGIAMTVAGLTGLLALRLTAPRWSWRPRGSTLRDWRASPSGNVVARDSQHRVSSRSERSSDRQRPDTRFMERYHVRGI